MLKNIKTLTLALLVTVMAIGIPLMGASRAFADSKGDICTGVGIATGNPGTCGGTTDTSGLNSTIAQVVSILSIIVGVAAVIMIIIGGLRYVISGGDSNNTSSAKNTILYALIGLAVAAIAQLLVHFVLAKL